MPPNPQGTAIADYTLPVLRFPDGSLIMNSKDIVPKLELLHPEPSLHLQTGLQDELLPILGKIVSPLMAWVFPKVRRNILTEGSDAWFKQDRERRMGMPEEQYEREKGGEEAWKTAEPGFQELTQLLKAHKKDEGPFILGSQVCYADLVCAGFCEFFWCIGNEAYEKFTGSTSGLRELHKACAPWLDRKN